MLPGLQSLPLLRLPIMLTPDPARHWSYDGALIDFRLARYAGAPGDVEGPMSGKGWGGGLQDCCRLVAVLPGDIGPVFGVSLCHESLLHRQGLHVLLPELPFSSFSRTL